MLFDMKSKFDILRCALLDINLLSHCRRR